MKTLTEKVRRLMVFNAKGGVGKTAIALNLALTHGYGLITNDRLSVVDQVLPDDQYLILNRNKALPKLDDDWPIVFDFGGYPDKRAIEALKIVDFVLIPVLPDRENIQVHLNFIKEMHQCIEEKRIIVIVNRTSGFEYQTARAAIHNFFHWLAIFNIKKSAVFARMIEEKKSVAELALKSPLHARHFRPVAEQFEKITRYMETSHDDF